jgi:hypothetical protein
MGIGVAVAAPNQREQAGRTTAADLVLEPIEEVQQFLNRVAR